MLIAYQNGCGVRFRCTREEVCRADALMRFYYESDARSLLQYMQHMQSGAQTSLTNFVSRRKGDYQSLQMFTGCFGPAMVWSGPLQHRALGISAPALLHQLAHLHASEAELRLI